MEDLGCDSFESGEILTIKKVSTMRPITDYRKSEKPILKRALDQESNDKFSKNVTAILLSKIAEEIKGLQDNDSSVNEKDKKSGAKSADELSVWIKVKLQQVWPLFQF